MRALLFLTLSLLSLTTLAQKTTVFGQISDQVTQETLIGANIVFAPGLGTATDINGDFSIQIEPGTYQIVVSYVGYEDYKKEIKIDGSRYELNVSLGSAMLQEVELVADIAIDRKTPVAFSNVGPEKIEEELGAQDLPMVLNSTPGVYATQQGGGDGDARINIRGFNQRNVAVMIDGVPVNDMENGWVYWSNWFGLDVITKSMQVQRGLGASKLAIPSVGGTINILTSNIQQKKKSVFKQEVGSAGFSRTTLSHSTGRLDNGWGFTGALSYKRSNGLVDQTYSEGLFYYLKAEKVLGNHTLSFSAFGAPQEHGQRSYKNPIYTYSSEYGDKLGIDTTGYWQATNKPANQGIYYNEHWGYFNGKPKSEKINYYHKPQISLRDFWSINPKLYMSNIVYVSIGNGGGTGILNAPGQRTETNNFDWDAIYASNQSVDNAIDTSLKKSSNILRASINNHFWVGGLSTINYNINDKYTFSGGVDLRYYKGEHYRIIYDLLGGDYYDEGRYSRPENRKAQEGDVIRYHNDGLVKWGGVFTQLEREAGNWTAFVNVSAAQTGYKRVDYFLNKTIHFNGQTFNEAIGLENSFVINSDTNLVTKPFEYASTSGSTTYIIQSYPVPGHTPDTIAQLENATVIDYDSPLAKHAQTDWSWHPSFTFKTGVNYNLNERSSAFMNVGYINKAPRFNNVYTNSNTKFREIQNEEVKAIEAGYSFRSPKFSANVNAYYTRWENRPVDRGVSVNIGGDIYSANINGMDAIHKGIELDFAYVFAPKWDLQGLISLGDWRWASADSFFLFDDDNNLAGSGFFDAKGVYVGDAAQTQFGATLGHEFGPGKYMKLKATYFGKHFAQFNPFDLNGSASSKDQECLAELAAAEGKDISQLSPEQIAGCPSRQSWQVPNYLLIDFFAGYRFKTKHGNLDLRAGVLNIANTMYISDATNNDPFFNGGPGNYDAASATVFFGAGTRFTVSAKLSF